MGDMAHEQPREQYAPQNQSHLPIVLWLLALLLVLYPLSVAPAVKFIPPSPSPPVQSMLATIYAPLRYLYASTPAVRTFYQWYGKLWGLQL
jgi:hypothetical protein